MFGSERLTGALLDRLTHHVHILEMNGDSYRLKQSKQRQRADVRPDRRSACHGARCGEGPVLAMLPRIKPGCAWLRSSHPLRCAPWPRNARSGRESRLTRSNRKAEFMVTPLDCSNAAHPSVMHFYSGPPMHFLSGVDTVPCGKVISYPFGIAARSPGGNNDRRRSHRSGSKRGQTGSYRLRKPSRRRYAVCGRLTTAAVRCVDRRRAGDERPAPAQERSRPHGRAGAASKP